MSVNVKAVEGRRELQFGSLDDIVSDVEKLVTSPGTKTLGNWPLGQLITHLSSTIDSSIDGFSAKAPFIIRLIGPFLKKGMLNRKMSPGIKLPKKAEADAFPNVTDPREAFTQLKSAVQRTQNEQMLAPHPAFGNMTNEEWVQLHLRHSEMHLSFAIPG